MLRNVKSQIAFGISMMIIMIFMNIPTAFSAPIGGFSSKQYQDIDGDGAVDQLVVAFNGGKVLDVCDVSDAEIATDWVYTGGDIGGSLTTTGNQHTCDTATETVTLKITGANANTTGHITAPTIAYNNADGDDSIVNQHGASGAIIATDLTDSTAPVFVSATANSDTNIQITMSEYINSVTFGDASAWTATGITSTAVVINGGDAKKLDITVNSLGSTAFTASDLAFTSGVSGSDIQDAVVNSTASFSGKTITDGQAPVPISTMVYDNTGSDGQFDLITVVWSENLGTVPDSSSDWAISSVSDFADLTEGTVECNNGGAAANECDYNFTTTTVESDVGDLTLDYTAGTSVTDGTNNAGSFTFGSGSTPPLVADAPPAPIGDFAVIQNSTAATVDIVITGSNFDNFISSGTAIADATDLAGITYDSANPTSATIDNSTTITAVFQIAIGTDKSGGSLEITANAIENSSTPNALIAILDGDITDSASPVITSITLKDTDSDGIADRLALNYSENLEDTASGANGFDVTSALDHGSCTGETADPFVSSSLNLDFTCTNIFAEVGDLTLIFTANAGVKDAENNQAVSQTLTSASTPVIVKGGLLVVTDANISISGGSGTGGAYIIGDTVTVTWDNSAAGDNNTDLKTAVADISGWGGGSVVSMTDTTACGGTDSDGIYEACYNLVAGAIDAVDVNATVTATDNSDNSLGPIADTANATVDNIAPDIALQGSLAITSDSGNIGVAEVGDTVTYNDGTIASADGDIWTADLTSLTGNNPATNAGSPYPVIGGDLNNPVATFTETATDNAGNIATGQTQALSVDNVAVNPLTNTSVALSDNKVNASVDFIIAFTITNNWPADGEFEITFPFQFNVSGLIGNTVKNLVNVDGTLTASVAGQTVTLTRGGGGATQVPGGTAVNFSIKNGVNGPTAGTTGTFTFKTLTNAGSLIDQDLAVPGVTLNAQIIVPPPEPVIVGGGGGGRRIVDEQYPFITRDDSVVAKKFATVADQILSRSIKLKKSAMSVNAETNTKTAKLTGKGTLTIKHRLLLGIFLMIPPHTEVEGGIEWDGKISLPVLKSKIVIHHEGEEIYGTEQKLKRDNIVAVLKAGSDGSQLKFSNDVNINIKIDLPDGSKVNIYSSEDGDMWKFHGTGVVKNKKLAIETKHFGYFAVEDAREAVSQVRVISKKVFKFYDIVGHWAESFINNVVSKGIMKNKREDVFNPNSQITREEFIKIVAKAFDIPSSDIKNTFNSSDLTEDIQLSGVENLELIQRPLWIGAEGEDVSALQMILQANGFYNGAISGLYDENTESAVLEYQKSLGWLGTGNVGEDTLDMINQLISETPIIEEDNKQIFRTNKYITRAIALKVLLQIAGFDLDEAITYSFSDINNKAWYAEYISFAKNKGIVSGYKDGTFRPANPITRAELSKIVMKVLDLLGQ